MSFMTDKDRGTKRDRQNERQTGQENHSREYMLMSNTTNMRETKERERWINRSQNALVIKMAEFHVNG